MSSNQHPASLSSESSSSVPSHARDRATLEQLIDRRISRRRALQGIAAAGAAGTALLSGAGARGDFEELPHVHPELLSEQGIARQAGVAPGHRMQVLLKWGDPLFANAPALDIPRHTARHQEQQFGYNNDFVAFLPLPRGSRSSSHGLLCVNHEYTDANLMFPRKPSDGDTGELRRQVDIERAAHGHSVVEIRRSSADWEVVRDSEYNRRLTATTEFGLSGPAAGHPRTVSHLGPFGQYPNAEGTLNNCAGGVTPWGTVLLGEENFQQYFHGRVPDEHPEAENHRRYGVGYESDYHWHEVYEWFDVPQYPFEPNGYGWVVEYDPYRRGSRPWKRTALGRMRHEGANCSVNHDGRVVVYMGDDSRFEFLYKFVSDRPFSENPEANRDLLDDGILYVAKFTEDGKVEWMPLVFGSGPLTRQNGFRDQADVLIETRRAASLLGATPMDRPEDVEENPASGRVYVMLTNNTRRTPEQVDPANPQARNRHGHIVELVLPRSGEGYDHAAVEHEWEIFLKAGAATGEGWYQGHQPTGWVSCPDNCAFDNQGRLWIATDGAQRAAGMNDGLYACATEGPERARTRQFFHGPIGSEICGPCFTPDNSTLFIAVQHPGEGSDWNDPSTRWPNPPDSPLPPQPAVVAVTRTGGGAVG